MGGGTIGRRGRGELGSWLVRRAGLTRTTSAAMAVGLGVAAVLEPAQGFAVAPGTVATDPAAGDPYWTWWTPLP